MDAGVPPAGKGPHPGSAGVPPAVGRRPTIVVHTGEPPVSRDTPSWAKHHHGSRKPCMTTGRDTRETHASGVLRAGRPRSPPAIGKPLYPSHFPNLRVDYAPSVAHILRAIRCARMLPERHGCAYRALDRSARPGHLRTTWRRLRRSHLSGRSQPALPPRLQEAGGSLGRAGPSAPRDSRFGGSAVRHRGATLPAFAGMDRLRRPEASSSHTFPAFAGLRTTLPLLPGDCYGADPGCPAADAAALLGPGRAGVPAVQGRVTWTCSR